MKIYFEIVGWFDVFLGEIYETWGGLLCFFENIYEPWGSVVCDVLQFVVRQFMIPLPPQCDTHLTL